MSMKLFDSHCHIDDLSFNKDIELVIDRARAAGVQAMMIAGINMDRCKSALALAKRYDGIIASVGVHPHDAKHCAEKKIKFLNKRIFDQRILHNLCPTCRAVADGIEM